MREISEAERAVLDHLGRAMIDFNELEVIFENDAEEMMLCIHAAQNIVLSRPAYESTLEESDGDAG